jgi:peptide/nickel transport system ATP-binding protein
VPRLVGESGCGKSTVALAILGSSRRRAARSPSTAWRSAPMHRLDRRRLARSVQMVFQDPTLP